MNIKGHLKPLSLLHPSVVAKPWWEEGNHPSNMVSQVEELIKCLLNPSCHCFSTKCS